MKKQRLMLVIDGAQFTIDDDQEILLPFKHTGQPIPFHDLKDEGDYYTTLFDKELKSIPSGMFELGADNHFSRIIIPHDLLYANRPLSKTAILEINEASKKGNWGITVVDGVKQQKTQAIKKGNSNRGI